MREPRKKGANAGAAPIIKPILFSTAVGILVVAVLLTLFSVAMTLIDIPQVLISPLTVLALAIGSYLGARTAGKILRSRGLVTGFLVASAMFLLVALASFIVIGAPVGYLLLVKLFAMLLAGGLGGVAGMNAKQRRK